MDEFVKVENIRHFRRLIEQTSDETERRRLEKLLAEEEAKGRLEPPHQTEQKYR